MPGDVPASAESEKRERQRGSREARRRRCWRDVDNDRRVGRALIPRAVYGGHGVPIAMAGDYRGITNRRCGQQIRGEKLAPSALLLTSIDAISGQIGFKIYGP